MNTITKKVDRNNINDETLREAVEVLKKGGLVAFPTETVYGLGGNALDATAAARIYAAKGRPSDNPLIVHIADIEALKILAADIPDVAYDIAREFWPGPLTMILKKQSIVPDATTGGLQTIAIRMPSDRIAGELIRQSGMFIAAPSANASGRPSTTKAEHVIEDLDGKVDYIIDGGAAEIGLESTIIDLSSDKPLILRPGYITIEQLKKLLPEIEYDKAVLRTKADDTIVAKAPGMKYKHYAPKGDLTIYEGHADKVVDKINKTAKEHIDKGYKVGILATDETKERYLYGDIKTLGSRKSEADIASHLFIMLREFDEDGIQYIYSESFNGGELGQAIMNRLLKAAGYRMENLDD